MDTRSLLLSERESCRSLLELNPYDANLYLQRAVCYEELGYPDLAAGDAYRALLLTDEVFDEGSEFHEQAVNALRTAGKSLDTSDADAGVSISSNGHELPQFDQYSVSGRFVAHHEERGQRMEEESWYDSKARTYAGRSYEILGRTLLECGDLRNAYHFIEKDIKLCPGNSHLLDLQRELVEKHRHEQSQKSSTEDHLEFNPKTELSTSGDARRELYPWNKHEPDRFSKSNIEVINAEIRKVAPKCEIRIVDLPLLGSNLHSLGPTESTSRSHFPTIRQLGIFATETIAHDETILLEPSVLTANNRHRDPLCDACSSPLAPISPSNPLPTCQDCDDIFFCSQACLSRAQELYHPAVCGIEDYDVVAKDPSPAAATDALYLLLVARTMAMSQSQDIHPLDLPQIKYLWGDFSLPSLPVERNLPFNFQNNIANPIHILTNMGIDPFAPDTLARYDTWVLNTLFSKFRGTANAKMNERSLRPDVAGVHWMWSLANHSCAPNAMWDWGAGGMGFVARGDDDVVQWGDKRKQGKIEQGDEVLNHYCDIRLPLKERREWAVGALGGVCMCERCVWEEREGMM